MEFKPLENEIWVDAKTFKNDYTGLYLVSNLGRCWSYKSNKFIGSWVNGHWIVALSKNNKPEGFMIGRLMLISFDIPIPEHLNGLPTSKLDCMHLDGNSENNTLENFQWGSRKENQDEINARIRKSEAKKGKNNHMYGKHHSEETKRKMSEAKKKPFLQYTKDGTFIRDWDCAMDAQRQLGINQSSISQCARGKCKSAGGYLWKYKEEA